MQGSSWLGQGNNRKELRMAYKDKDKQRQAQREAARRYRAKGMTKGMTQQGMTVEGMTEPKARASHPDTQVIWDRHAAQHRPTTYPHKFNDGIGLALPGDADYAGVCT